MKAETIEDAILDYVLGQVETPNGFGPDDLDKYPEIDTYHQKLDLMKWEKRYKKSYYDEALVTLSYHYGSDEEKSFDISVEVEGSVYHAHSARKFDESLSIVESCLYMLNHLDKPLYNKEKNTGNSVNLSSGTLDELEREINSLQEERE